MNVAELLIDEGQLNIGLPSYVVHLIESAHELLEIIEGDDDE